jgi:hypothetical protein
VTRPSPARRPQIGQNRLICASPPEPPSTSQVPHCQGWEISRGVEEPGHFVVRIEWDSLGGHEQGFRRSPAFPASSPPCCSCPRRRAQAVHYTKKKSSY